jgi:peptide/nickel transport system substrate-binding protein
MIKQAWIAGLVFALLVSLVTNGCTRVSVSERHAAGVVAPGILRVRTGRFDNLNTVLSGGGSSTYLSYLWGAYLFLADDKNQLVPELATEIPTLENGGISRDGLDITYHLRRGVYWHDGAPFDARDIIFTWHAIMNPKNIVVTHLGYDKVAAMTAVDPYTVRVHLKQPYAPAVSSLFGPGEVPMPILPQHLLGNLPDLNHAAFNNKPVGTGPFIVDRYDPSTGVFLTANTHYWRGQPKLRGIDDRIIPDPNTANVMLKTNELDAAVVYAMHAAELASYPGVKIVRESAAEAIYLAFNVTHPPFDDSGVRRALAMGVDRKFFVRVFEHATGSVAETDQPPSGWAFNPNAREPSYDPAQAQRLLDTLGWRKDASGYRVKNGKPLSLTFAYITGRDPDAKFAPWFQSAMKELGVAVTLKSYEYSLFYAQKEQGGILNGGHYDMAIAGWVWGVDPDDATLWDCDQIPPLGYNISRFCDPRIDALERIALRSYDPNTRRDAYWKIQSMLDNELPAIFLSWIDVVWATRDSVKDFRPGENFYGSWNWRKD